jgi:hypothetical protein
MKNAGIDKPGTPTNKKPHLGDLLLKRYKNRIMEGAEDLTRISHRQNNMVQIMRFLFYFPMEIIDKRNASYFYQPNSMEITISKHKPLQKSALILITFIGMIFLPSPNR